MNFLKKASIFLLIVCFACAIRILPVFIMGRLPPVVYDPKGLEVFFQAVIAAPILEEIIFRGPLYLVLNIKGEGWIKFLDKFGTIIAVSILVIWSSFTFGLLHITNLSEPYPEDTWFYVGDKVWTGLVFGTLVYKTKNLFSSIALHFLNNLVWFLFF